MAAMWLSMSESPTFVPSEPACLELRSPPPFEIEAGLLCQAEHRKEDSDGQSGNGDLHTDHILSLVDGKAEKINHSGREPKGDATALLVRTQVAMRMTTAKSYPYCAAFRVG